MSSESPPASQAQASRRRAPVRRATRRGHRSALRLLDVTLLAAFLALTFLLGVFPLKDTDFWWHLRTGDLIRQTGAGPDGRLYTFTVAGHPWIDLHWLFQVALSWVYARGGVAGADPGQVRDHLRWPSSC